MPIRPLRLLLLAAAPPAAAAAAAATFLAPFAPLGRGPLTCPAAAAASSSTALRLDGRLERVAPPFGYTPVGVATAPGSASANGASSSTTSISSAVATATAPYDLDALLAETDEDLRVCQQELENLSLLVPSLEELYDTTVQIQEALARKEAEHAQTLVFLQREQEISLQEAADRAREEARAELDRSLAATKEAAQQKERELQAALQREKEEAQRREAEHQQKLQLLSKEVTEARAQSAREQSLETELRSQVEALERQLREQQRATEAATADLQRLEREAIAKVAAADAQVRANHQALQENLRGVAEKEKRLAAEVRKIGAVLQEMKATVAVTPRQVVHQPDPHAFKAPAGANGVNGHNGYAANGYSSPANGHSSPANGYSSPANGYGSPANGYSSPANGYSSLANGYSSPANGYSSPANGFSSPANGYSSPANGYSSPANGYSSPTNGYRPANGVANGSVALTSSTKSVAASTGDYLSLLNGSAAAPSSRPKASFAPYSGVKPSTSSHSNGIIQPTAASPADYLQSLSGQAPASATKKSYSPFGGEVKVVKDTSFLGTLSGSNAQVSAPANGQAHPLTAVSTSEYLGSKSQTASTTAPKKSYAPGGGGTMRVVSDTGYLGHLNAPAPVSTSAPASSSALSAVPASVSSGDYMSAMSHTSHTSGPKKSYAPGGGTMRIVKDAGYLGNLNSVLTSAPAFNGSPSTAAASSSGDYLSSMSASFSASGPKKSYAPGGGTMKIVKDSGYLGNLNSVAPASSGAAVSGPTPVATVAAASSGDYLSSMSRSASAIGLKKSYAPGGGTMRTVKDTGYLGNLNSATSVSPSAPSSASGPTKSYAPGGGSMRIVKDTGYLGNLNSAAPISSAPASSVSPSITVVASSGDYLSSMSRSVSASGQKKSYAPGGGTMKIVKDTGYLGNLNSASMASPSVPASTSGTKKSYAPGGGNMRIVKDTGYLGNLNSVAPMSTSSLTSSAPSSTAAAASSGDYLNSMTRSTSSSAPKKSYAPGGGKMRIVKETGYLGNLNSVASVSTSAPVSSTGPATTVAATASSADYLSSMTRSISASGPKKSYAPGGGTMRIVKDTGYLGNLNSAAPISTSAPASSAAPSIAAVASSGDYLSSMSHSTTGPKKSYAPGGGSMRIVKDTGYLGHLNSDASVSSSGAKKSYAPGGSTMRIVKDTGYLGNLNSAASVSTTAPVSSSASSTASTASSGDYLSTMSQASSSTEPKKSYAPGGGTMRVVKDTGYLGNLHGTGTSITPKSYAPGGGNMRIVKETGYLGGLSPASSNILENGKDKASDYSDPATKPNGNYLSAISRSPVGPGPKKSYAPGSGAMKSVENSGYLGSLTSANPVRPNESMKTPKLIAIEPVTTSTSDYLRSTTVNTAEYLNNMARDSASFTGGNMLVVDNSTISSGFSSRATYASTNTWSVDFSEHNQVTSSAKSAANMAATVVDAPSTNHVSPVYSKKSYAPGASTMKVARDTSYLGALSSAPPLPSFSAHSPELPKPAEQTSNIASSELSKAAPIDASLASLYSSTPGRALEDTRSNDQPGWTKDGKSPIGSYLSSL